MGDGSKSKPSFWTTLPGILTGLAAVLGALTALITVLTQLGVFTKPPTPTTPVAGQVVPVTQTAAAAQLSTAQVTGIPFAAATSTLAAQLVSSSQQVGTLAPAQTIQTSQGPAAAVPTPAKLAIHIDRPSDGATVGSAVPIIGTRTGTLEANQHLWIFVHPEDGSTNWWPHPDELKADTGDWQVTIDLSGAPSRMVSEVRVGAVGEVSQQAILSHLRSESTCGWIAH
jgi:hypothetical protein